MKDCFYRVKTHYGQYICTISCFYCGRTLTCQQISEEKCNHVRELEQAKEEWGEQ